MNIYRIRVYTAVSLHSVWDLFDNQYTDYTFQVSEPLVEFARRMCKEGFMASPKKWICPGAILSIEEVGVKDEKV